MISAALLAAVVTASPATAFTSSRVVSGLTRPVAFALAPDGRVFICEQGGALRVVRDGRLLARAAVHVHVEDSGEQGLLGVAVDRDFTRTQRLFLVYTPLGRPVHVVVASVELSGDTLRPGSRRELFRSDALIGTVHAGGSVALDATGHLLVGLGDGDDERAASSLHSSLGKILRIARDGGVPLDNPFLSFTDGPHRAIWARGFRNPFAIGVHPRTGRVRVNDVGHQRFEEIDDVQAGDHLGWPLFEGPSIHPEYRTPRHAYDHASGCSITGGAFYAAPSRELPLPWRDGWFFTDFCQGDLRWLAPGDSGRLERLGALPAPGPVAMAVDARGALWVLARGAVDVSGAGGATGVLDRLELRSQ